MQPYLPVIAILLAIALPATAATPPQVTWSTPSSDARGSMPLGNGDIALNAWVEPSGDLLFYIGKSDAWEDNSRLAKVGLVRVKLTPSLLPSGAAFTQTLDPARGEMTVTVTPATGRANVILGTGFTDPGSQAPTSSRQITKPQAHAVNNPVGRRNVRLRITKPRADKALTSMCPTEAVGTTLSRHPAS
jgi:hypothetical protein